MKRLILIRHAKSSWSNSDIGDEERPLNSRGQEAAQRMGAWLATEGLVPGQVIASTATRCRETWAEMSATLGTKADVQFKAALYLAETDEMLTVLRSATADVVLMLGHMPGLGAFARDMRRDPPPNHEMFQKYPTGAATVLDFNISNWADTQPATGKFVTYQAPKDL